MCSSVHVPKVLAFTHRSQSCCGCSCTLLPRSPYNNSCVVLCALYCSVSFALVVHYAGVDVYMYSTDHAELIFERRVRAILLEKPTCETRARDLEYSNARALELELHSNARLLELEKTSSARTRGCVRYSYASCTSNVGGLYISRTTSVRNIP